MRKLTHEEFMDKFNTKNTHAKDIEILGTYKNNKTKIKCKCKIHEYEWETKPACLLNGTGCPICGRKMLTQKQRKTHEQFIQELYKINPDIEVLETYVNAHTKIKCKCRIDGYEWEVIPKSLLRGGGCPKCVGNNKLTHEEFISRMNKKNNNIEILGEYVNSATKIKVRCKIDGHIWEPQPQDLLKGHGCPKCAGLMRHTHEQFLQKLQQVNPDIEILGTYVNNRTKIKCKCKIDGYEWEVLPSSLLSGHGCPKCGGTGKLTHEEFLQELYKVNPDIEVLEDYQGAKIKIKCKCKLDGYEWEAKPNNLLNGNGCPKCNISKGEKRVAQYLDNLDIDYTYNKKYFNDLVGTGGGLLRPDFIIPTLKIWIEYDGIQHFEPQDFTGKMSAQEVQEQFEYTQQNDQIKNEYAEQNNWTLIRIAYWDYDNIEQILDSYLKQEEELAL